MATKKAAVKKGLPASKTAASKTAANKTAASKTASANGSTKKLAPTKTAAKGVAAKKTPATKAPAKKAPAPKQAAKVVAKSAAKKKGEDNYTDPALREKIKDEVMAGDKGGHPGQWSARKAQLVAHEYVAEGGGYKHPRNEAQEHLKEWGDEKWHTADGKPAIRDDGQGQEETHRYLPGKAWAELSPEEKKATDAKKVRGSRTGKQFIANTEKAKQARKHAEK